MGKTPSSADSFEDVRAILREVSLMHKEAAREMKEIRASQKTDREGLRKSQEAWEKKQEAWEKKQEAWEKKQEAWGKKRDEDLRKSRKKFDLDLQKSREEFKREMKERDEKMNRMFKQTELHIQKIGGQFNTKWGFFVESLVQGNLVELLQSRGVDVDQIFPNVTKERPIAGGLHIIREYDILAANGSEAVAVEVKTTLSVKDVRSFIEDGLKNFKRHFPIYKDHVLYGAMGYLKASGQAADLAERSGLFVIRAAGGSGVCANSPGFKPKAFG